MFRYGTQRHLSDIGKILIHYHDPNIETVTAVVGGVWEESDLRLRLDDVALKLSRRDKLKPK